MQTKVKKDLAVSKFIFYFVLMTATAALAAALLRGDVVTIKTSFHLFALTNAPREISRAIEKPFGLEVSRVKKEGKSKWGVYCTWTEYRLNASEHNLEGMAKLAEYVKANGGDVLSSKRPVGRPKEKQTPITPNSQPLF